MNVREYMQCVHTFFYDSLSAELQPVLTFKLISPTGSAHPIVGADTHPEKKKGCFHTFS